jgi:gamma-glutamyltranspeptidase
MRTLQTLINVVDFGMNIQQAIEAPRWTTSSFPSSVFPHTMYPGAMAVEARIPEATRDGADRAWSQAERGGAVVAGSNAGIVVR